mmetsp:Transcript_60949/g.137844  ORF Transcript_60949/g.137844 Transcript_60949/m.137844 type:complete len:89 (-) Transcript_60949:1316-1582(-)
MSLLLKASFGRRSAALAVFAATSHYSSRRLTNAAEEGGDLLRVALCQLKAPGADKAANIKHAEAEVKAAAAKGAQLVVLPEVRKATPC